MSAHADVALPFAHIVMPEVNGAVLADEARSRFPGLRVLVRQVLDAPSG